MAVRFKRGRGGELIRNRGEAAPVLCRDSGCVVSSRDSHLRDERRAQLAALLDASGTVLRLAAPLVDLLVRLSLAKAFFAPGMLPSSHLFAQTGWPTIIVQVAGPVLLAAGLWVRPVALLMLVLTLLAQTFGPPQDEHLFWAALFGWYVAQGAGPLSLDHLLAKGLGFSPLPLAGRAMAAAGWFDRWVGPLYRLAVRLWLAAALAGDALAPSMLPATASAMLPATASAMLPRPWALLAAALLGVGLGTPLVAAGLLVEGTSMAVAGTDQAMTVYAPLLLALLGVSGAGRQIQMLRRLSQIYGVAFSENRGKALIASLAGSMIPTTSGIGAASVLKAVPIVGTIVAGFVIPVLSAGATYAIGKAFIQHFASGGTLLDFNPPDYREFVKASKEMWDSRSTSSRRSAQPSSSSSSGLPETTTGAAAMLH